MIRPALSSSGFKTKIQNIPEVLYNIQNMNPVNYFPLCINEISLLFIELNVAINLSSILCFFLYYVMTANTAKVSCNKY
jgi:hypothetical protein